MRVCLFTDTLNDVNGVSRFIRNVGHQAALTGRDLHLITSTRFPPPPIPTSGKDGASASSRASSNGTAARVPTPEEYMHNPAPLYARPMPGYPQLEIVLPPKGKLWKLARALRPDVIHVSTPGPVGMAGRAIARKLGVPLIGTYHTDFPAYIDHLFNDPSFTLLTTASMKHFYRPFSRLFTRSADYGRALVRMGFPEERIVRLLPGIDTEVFNTRYRDPSGAVWARCPGVRAGSIKALYVGRVSVEKNLPMLTALWPKVHARARAAGVDAQLLVVGDGPYKATMQQALESHDAFFLGFRHGEELSTIYASSNLFIFPSTTDTLGQVVMEAQSAGLPVVVTDRGGPGEVVDRGETGYVLSVTSSGHEQAWVETVAGLVTDHERRRAMGEKAAAKIAPMSIRHSFEHFWSVHEAALAESRH